MDLHPALITKPYPSFVNQKRIKLEQMEFKFSPKNYKLLNYIMISYLRTLIQTRTPTKIHTHHEVLTKIWTPDNTLTCVGHQTNIHIEV